MSITRSSRDWCEIHSREKTGFTTLFCPDCERGLTAPMTPSNLPLEITYWNSGGILVQKNALIGFTNWIVDIKRDREGKSGKHFIEFDTYCDSKPDDTAFNKWIGFKTRGVTVRGGQIQYLACEMFKVFK